MSQVHQLYQQSLLFALNHCAVETIEDSYRWVRSKTQNNRSSMETYIQDCEDILNFLRLQILIDRSFGSFKLAFLQPLQNIKKVSSDK